MSTSINIQGFSSTENQEFKKHYEAVKFCAEKGLSYPIETSEFFKGKIQGDDLEDIEPSYILKYIENGIEVNLPVQYGVGDSYESVIKVADIPKECDRIIIGWS